MDVNGKKKVFVALSGGVDSSVAALLLRDRGYDVTGVFMSCYNLDGCAERDAADARRVASHLGIPFYSWDFKDEYKKRVVEYMVEGYRKGETPNPDVVCNKEIKFGLFLEKALAIGADYVATGHYVRKVIDDSGIGNRLFTARDTNKDQSYFLWTLKQKQLERCLFPIGDYLKPEVREMARKAGLPTAEKKDSQGICFLGKVTLAEFLKEYIPSRRGEVFDAFGRKIGEHDGAEFYTIGERHVGVAVSKPVYVAEKDVKANTLVMAEADDDSLYRKEIRLTNLNFISPNFNGGEVLARVRYRQPLAKAMLWQTQNSKYQIPKYKLEFDEPIKFVAAGQSAVFYSGENELLGGGVIL
ncbi:MAG TPA: tRNA 2-thiouridine(34) synthase MnmA [Candidatus Paceibacterota bacterium]|nr:tRNA 2-thiouridine(34) synthase MnmA [Candidatus Paceibacterota bacterium]